MQLSNTTQEATGAEEYSESDCDTSGEDMDSVPESILNLFVLATEESDFSGFSEADDE